MSERLMMTDELVTLLIEFRRQLHRQPELSLQEFETTARIREFLQQHDIELIAYPLVTGVIARVRGKHEGPCIAVRADIDALPILEETGLPFASEVPGKMHACGHDFHTAAALGAAVLTKQVADSESSFAGDVLFIFQPAEEIGQGAQVIVDTGVFQDYDVKGIIGEHNNPLLPAGKVAFKEGPLMGSVDDFQIVIHGMGGHAAIPDLTIDPILIGAHIVSGLQHIVSRFSSPLTSVVVTVGQFHAGTANNVIPMEATLDGTVRCLDPAMRDLVQERFTTFVKQTAAAFGATVDIQFEQVLPGVTNDAKLTGVARDAAVALLGEASVEDAMPTLGGEDFSLYQQAAPGCFFWVGTGRPDGSSQSWHHPAFDVDETMIATTSRVFVASALASLRAYA